MKLTFGLLTATLALGTLAQAADIYVAPTKGHLTRKQAMDVTRQVQDTVNDSDDNETVKTAAAADFILQPSVISRGDELVLRVEKMKNGEILAMSEQTIGSVNDVQKRVDEVTTTAMTDSSYGSAYATDDDGTNDTASATSVSASDIDSADAANDDSSERSDRSSASTRSSNSEMQSQSSGPIEVSGNASNAAASPATRTDSTATYSTKGTDSTAASPGADASVGELTSASPRMLNPDRIGQVQLGIGPSFGINMKDDSLMYDLMAAYAINFGDNWVGKVFGDFNIATGSSVTHFINLGLAGEWYPSKELLTFGKPYLAADLGYAFARDALSRTGDGLAGGVGAGFKFQAAQMNWDVAANYTLLLSQVADETPSVFGLRVALGF